MALEKCEWDIVSGPGKFDFAVAYIRGEEIELTLRRHEGAAHPQRILARLDYAVPRVYPDRRSWIIWGTCKFADGSGRRYFHGSYNINFESHRGWIDFVTKEQHDFNDLDRT